MPSHSSLITSPSPINEPEKPLVQLSSCKGSTHLQKQWATTYEYTYICTAWTNCSTMLNLLRKFKNITVTINSFLPHAVSCVRFRFWHCDFFVSVWNISGTTEKICAKFTRKTCLVHRSDEFEGQGHQGQKKRVFSGYLRNCWTDLRQIHTRRIWSLARTSLKVKVNFGSLCAVYV